ncbi:MAG: radical SAM protein [Ferruginibacter sp.]
MSGIYIHIPFCRQACSYCNFHFSTSLLLKDRMIAAIVKEIHLSPLHSAAEPGGRETIDTVYFGGGTPSLIETEGLLMILDALQNKFLVHKKAEITLEANPDDITPLKLNSWIKARLTG